MGDTLLQATLVSVLHHSSAGRAGFRPLLAGGALKISRTKGGRVFRSHGVHRGLRRPTKPNLAGTATRIRTDAGSPTAIHPTGWIPQEGAMPDIEKHRGS